VAPAADVTAPAAPPAGGARALVPGGRPGPGLARAGAFALLAALALGAIVHALLSGVPAPRAPAAAAPPDRQVDRQVDSQADHQVDGSVDGQVDGQIDDSGQRGQIASAAERIVVVAAPGSEAGGGATSHSPKGDAVVEDGAADAADGVWLEGVWDPQPFRRRVAVGRGDTLMDLLVGAGVDRGEAGAAVAALRPVYDPRRLKPGQELAVKFFPESEGQDRFLGLSLDVDHERTVAVARDGEAGFAAREITRPLVRELVRAGGKIRSSLYIAGIKTGVPPMVMIDLIRIFSFDVDFQRDIHPGDGFEVMYERFFDERRQVARNGEVQYAALTLGSKRIALWRFETDDGGVDYYDAKGHSVRKALMRTPIDGARLSSGFGMRRHPILGYSRMHRGVDFAAPRGTPVYAAGDGVVEEARRNGNYGNYIRLRHGSEYRTAYAHLKGFARGLRPGKRVNQGQVIGYVGTTGRSTGPHLHYEVLRHRAQINPITMRLPSGRRLAGEALARYQSERAEMQDRYLALAATARTAHVLGSDGAVEEGSANTD